MSFSDKQIRALGRSVPADAIRTRMSSGKELTFIEGWYAVAQANRIFGFDGWDRETVETKCLQAREARGTFTAIYSAKVRITVRTADAVVIREGHGTGEANGGSPGEVQDRALKAAETDATKRALVTFGKAFGLALYAGERHPRPRSVAVQHEDRARRGVVGALTLTPLSAPIPQPPQVMPPPVEADAPAGILDLATPSAVQGPANAVPQPESAVAALLAEATKWDRDKRVRPAQPALVGSRPRIDKNLLTFPEPSRVRDKNHLRYVAAQPCLLCSTSPSDPHHVRFAQPRAMSRKVGDDFTVPLCRKHHRDLHDGGNEAAWWHEMGIEPLEIAKDLWDESRKTREMFANRRLDEARPTINGESRTSPVNEGPKHAVD